MLVYQLKFNDVYTGRKAGPGEYGAFNDPESWDRLHPNTITIKSYPEMVSVTQPPESTLAGGGSRRLVNLRSRDE